MMPQRSRCTVAHVKTPVINFFLEIYVYEKAIRAGREGQRRLSTLKSRCCTTVVESTRLIFQQYQNYSMYPFRAFWHTSYNPTEILTFAQNFLFPLVVPLCFALWFTEENNRAFPTLLSRMRMCAT